MESMMADLPRSYFIISGGHWVGTGSQPLWLLVMIALAFSVALWSIGKLLEFLTCAALNRRPAESASSLSGLENINIPTEYHVVGLSHIPECEEMVSSCVEAITSCVETLHP